MQPGAVALRHCYRVCVSVDCVVGLQPRTAAGGDVMASVNGRKIYRSEVDKYYANQTAGSDQQPTGEQAVSLRLSILNELIETEILMQRAEKLGLLATDEEVDRKLNEIKSPYTAEEFNKRLEEKKISLDDFKRDLRRSLTRDKVLNKEITSRINITDQDVSDLLQRAQGGVQPDRTAISPGENHGLGHGDRADAQPAEQQGAKRCRGAQENPDDRQSAG